MNSVLLLLLLLLLLLPLSSYSVLMMGDGFVQWLFHSRLM